MDVLSPKLADRLKVPKRVPKALLFLLPAALIGVIGIVQGRRFFRPQIGSAIQLNGRIEAYETDVSAKVSGLVEQITVREGELVDRDEVIARLDSAELQATLAGAEARVAAANQGVSQALLQVSVVESQMEEAQLAQLQAQDDTAGRISSARASVAAARAQLAQAQAQEKQVEAELVLAQSDRDRFQQLYQSGAATQQRFEQAQTQLAALQETLQARRAAIVSAQEQVAAAQGALTQSNASRLTPQIRSAQVQRLATQQLQAKSQLSAAQSDVESAEANRQEIEAKLDDLEITSPIDGVVLTRTTEPGEVITPGTTIVTLVNLDDVFLRGYIPEEQIGALQIGQDAQVFLDSAPTRPLSATVAAIDAEASFTPENIYFRDDRITQVFGLKLSIDNPDGFAKPGMPADATISIDPAAK